MSGIILRFCLFCALIGGAFFWFVTQPSFLAKDWVAHSSDADAGALVFAAAGCASCHVAPTAEKSDPPVLSGGRAFVSDFGTFYAPNISSDAALGIGNWTQREFAQALLKGVSPDGAHYYPAFPYTAYARMTSKDIGDLYAYVQTLPASNVDSIAHEISFPFSIRRSVGGWKRLYMAPEFHVQGQLSALETRGRYLAEALGHCAECHTPRDAIGGLDKNRWLAGAPSPTGKGKIPNITPGVLGWSESDLVGYFTSGLTPDYDSAGGDMVVVIENLTKLPQSDREAIAAYLLRVEPLQ